MAQGLTGFGLAPQNPTDVMVYPFLEGFKPTDPMLFASRYLYGVERHINSKVVGHKPMNKIGYAGFRPAAGAYSSNFATNAGRTREVAMKDFFSGVQYTYEDLRDHPLIGQYFGSGVNYQRIITNDRALALIRLLTMNAFAQDTLTQLFLSDTKNSLPTDATGRKNLTAGAGENGTTRKTFYSGFDGVFAKFIARLAAGTMPASQSLQIAENNTGTYSLTMTGARAIEILKSVHAAAPSAAKADPSSVFLVTDEIYDALVVAQYDKIFNAGFTPQMIKGMGADFSTALFELREIKFLNYTVAPMSMVSQAIQADFAVSGVSDRPHRVIFGPKMPFMTNFAPSYTNLTGTDAGIIGELKELPELSVLQYAGMKAEIDWVFDELYTIAGVEGGAFPIIP